MNQEQDQMELQFTLMVVEVVVKVQQVHLLQVH
jgi:hypothetical protein